MLFTVTASAQTLVLAQLSDRPKKDLKQLRPMVEYMAEKLAHQGMTRGGVKLYSNLADLQRAVASGEVSWVTETPFSAASLVHNAAAIPLLMKWKSGQKYYQSILYTRSDSAIKGLADLRGKTIAFEHKNSFSSYILPRMLLEQQPIPLHPLQDLQQPRSSEQLNYAFSRNEKNNLLWVHKGLVDIGALNNGDWDNPKRVPPELKGELKIIYRSHNYPRAFELVSPKLTSELRDALRQQLLSLTLESQPRLLHRYEKTTGFEPVTPAMSAALREIYQFSQSYN